MKPEVHTMNRSCIKLNHNVGGSIVYYTIPVDAIMSFNWNRVTGMTTVVLMNGTTFEVCHTPAQIKKKLDKAQRQRKPSVEDASAHPSEGVRA